MWGGLCRCGHGGVVTSTGSALVKMVSILTPHFVHRTPSREVAMTSIGIEIDVGLHLVLHSAALQWRCVGKDLEGAPSAARWTPYILDILYIYIYI